MFKTFKTIREIRELLLKQAKRQQKEQQSLSGVVDKLKSLDKSVSEVSKQQQILLPFLNPDPASVMSHELTRPYLLEEYGRLLEMRETRAVGVNQPMVLITQIHRSGGTLLSQLFDGHPEIHCHPYELHTGYPDKTHWPVLNLSDNPTEWFRQLYEPSVGSLFSKGYSKQGRAGDKGEEPMPFLLMPLFLRSLFLEILSKQSPGSQREIINAYLSAYFNAWLDNHNLYQPGKKWVSAFVPRLNMEEENLDRFFADYPDGRLIQILRDPQSWYNSARRHQEAARTWDAEEQVMLWVRSLESMKKARAKYADRVRIICFEDLVTRTEEVMKGLCDFLGIRFDPVLLTPTFNFMPVKANSSFLVTRTGVIPDSANRRDSLPSEEQAMIDRQTRDLYESALQELCSQ